MMKTMTDDELIEQYITADPWDGPSEARLTDFGVQVWALVGALPAANDDIAELARAYALPLEAVEAAMAYYRRYQANIDARVLLNNETFD
jgi:uncharacterized protein (DUF433 family)